MGYRVGVDIGGTFTDFCAFDEASEALYALKVLSTPERPGAEVMAGLRELERRFGIAPDAITYFTHGTTVGVNTVIQRKGITLGLFVTENFTDVLEIARLKMPDPYDLTSRRPEPLVPRDRVLPIRERMRGDGTIDTPVDEASVRAAVERALALGVEGIVIALINAYRNPAHEKEVRAIVERAAPGVAVFCSTDVWSIVREYERTVTAVIHGYVQPRVSHYLGSLQAALAEAGVPAEPLVTKSNGGVMSAELGKTACAQMILSGTAAGGPLLNVKTTDNRTGRRIMANIDPILSGAGGLPWQDGADGSGANHSFFKNTPVEINEAEVPIKILRYGLATDSGGAGRYRGGTANTLEFQAFAPNSVLTARNRDRVRFTPWGINGGAAGKPSEFLRNPGTNREVNLGNTDVVTVEPGDIIRITAAGAGGWGPPAEREPERVLADVRRGFVSVAGAAEDYGVVIVGDEVDHAATERRRAAMDGPDGEFFGHNAARIDFERTWTRETYRVLGRHPGPATGALARLCEAQGVRRHRGPARRCAHRRGGRDRAHLRPPAGRTPPTRPRDRRELSYYTQDHGQ